VEGDQQQHHRHRHQQRGRDAVLASLMLVPTMLRSRIWAVWLVSLSMTACGHRYWFQAPRAEMT
jgi:hypothetical protein